MGRVILKVDKDTGEVIARYGSYREAAEDCDFTTVRRACLAKSLTSFGWCWRFEEDYDPEECYEGRQNAPFMVLDTKTGRLRTFPNVRETAEFLQASVPLVWKGCYQEGPVLGRYEIKRKTKMGEEPWK